MIGLSIATSTTGMYNYIDVYVPEVFKTEQTNALRLILTAALVTALSFFVIVISLGSFHHKPPKSENEDTC